MASFRTRTVLVVLAASAVLLSGCAPAPESSGEAEGSEYCARMVTNSGGLEDRSFNQSSWEGLKLAEATTEHAAENPDLHFVIVDEVVEADNVKPVVFDTAQAAFLAGYLAAGVTKTGVVGTFGGDSQPPVTLFMDGFVDGVAQYNSAHGTEVRVLGWNKETQDGVFTGDYENVTLGRTTTEGMLDQNADVILPVAGQVGEGAAAAIKEHGSGSLIWVDNDGYETLPAEFRGIVLTSILKNTQDAIVEIVGADLDGDFSSEPFIGTLENGGVGIAPFHDLDGMVSAELQAELEQLTQDIISGTLEVTSPSSPR